jgi:hypothetical protein
MSRCALKLLHCFVVLSLTACAPSTASPDSAAYKAVPLKGKPVVTFTAANDALSIDVASPAGIGGAAIEKTAGQWPSRILVRLHVKGLESFKFHYADITIEVNASSHGDKTVRETRERTGLSDTPKPGDPDWIAVTPGEDYFDIKASTAFLKSGANKFTIEWIDFYR